MKELQTKRVLKLVESMTRRKESAKSRLSNLKKELKKDHITLTYELMTGKIGNVVSSKIPETLVTKCLKLFF